MAWTKEQQLAIDEFGKNIIVSAGAGSGKTAVLSERVLKHVLDNIDIEDMLILTFTNAAAREMKERIRKKLLDKNLKEQADKIDLAYITTFDAYALSILKKYSYTLNIGKNISVIDNSIISLKKKEILNEIFDSYYDKEDELFLKLINDFCLKDDKEIFDAILSLNKQLDNKFDKLDYLNNYVNNYYDEKNINRLIDEYLNLINKKICSLNNQLDNIKNYTDEKFIIKLRDVLLPLINSKKYEDIKYYSYNINLPRLSNSTEEAKLIKDEIKSIIDEIKELTKYNDLDKLKKSLLSTKDYVNVIVKIILELDKRIFEYKKKNNSYEFIDIIKMSINILKENESIALSLKNKFKEILIDEYQDTNDLQDIFISLIENNNVYMVGDIKQSIYKFRNANPMLFKKKYDDYSNSDIGMKIDLNKNFRSRENVVSGINLIFNLIMDNNIGGASYFLEHQMIFGQENYLNVNKENYDMEFLNYEINKDDKTYSKTEIEIFTIANDINKKINSNYQVMDKETNESRSVRYSDFAILIDRSKHFNLYKKIFEYLNIPVNVLKDQNISDNINIKILKNIYNLLICIRNKNYNNNFKYSFVSLSRSYLFEYSDNDIIKYLNNKNYYDSELFKICKEIVNNIDVLSNLEIYELILDSFDIYNKLIKIGDVKKHLVVLDYVYKLIESTDKLGYTFEMFYDYLVSIFNEQLDIGLSLNKESSDCVQIMTIHTSKGLEYPICYFPALDEKFNIGDLKNKFYYSNNYGLVLPYFNDGINTTFVKELLKNNYYEEEISEKLRLFYVALTRAREKMIFVTQLSENILSYKEDGVVNDNTRLAYRSFIDILNSIYKNIKKYIINVNINDIGLTKKYNYSKLNDNKNDIKNGNVIIVNELNINDNLVNKNKYSKDSHKIYSKSEKENIKLGLKMHQILENYDFLNKKNELLKKEQIELIDKFLNTKLLDNVINIYKEYEFIYELDNNMYHGIIDLLLEYDDYYNIVDYKLRNINDEAYLKQLNGYKNYIESITNKRVYIYLYSILDGLLEKIK